MASVSHLGYTPPLDVYPGAQGAWSLRKLATAWVGPAIRVRRISDGAFQDIGFSANGDLDTVALLAFMANPTDSLEVETWFDQSGNGNDLRQAIALQQPLIVGAGVINTAGPNGKPSTVWEGTGIINQTNMRTGGWTGFLDGSQFQVQRIPDNAIDLSALMFQGAVPGEYYSFYESGNLADPVDNAAGIAMPASEYWVDQVQVAPKNRDQLFQDYGPAAGPGNFHYVAMLHLNLTGFTSLKVGQSTVNAADGRLSEIIHFNVDYTASRAAITDNQKAYYG